MIIHRNMALFFPSQILGFCLFSSFVFRAVSAAPSPEKTRRVANRQECAAQSPLVCNVSPVSESSVTGRVIFRPIYKGLKCQVLVTAVIRNLPGQYHGFHIHQYGDISSDTGASTGGHFANPEGSPVPHGLPKSPERHWGDFGSLKPRNASQPGVAYYRRTDHLISLAGIVGRGMTIHALKDLGPKYQPSGAAGPRIAVCVIGFANPSSLM